MASILVNDLLITFFYLLWGVPFFLVGLIWFQRKKRYDLLNKDRVIIPRYEAPEGLLPAAVGTLRDNRLDERDIVAGVVSLATQGYLTITEKKEKGKDYVIAQTKKPWPTDDLSFDRRLLQSLFGFDYMEEVKNEVVLFSELSEKFHRSQSLLQVTVEGNLRHAGFFRKNAFPLFYQHGFTVLIMIGGVYFLSSQMVLLGALLLGGGIISLMLLSTFPRRKTLRGFEIAYQIRCYREYLLTAELDRVEWQEQQYLYEKHLPYAIALGVADIWSDRFDGFAEIPSWFTGTRKMRLKYVGGQFNKLLMWMITPKDPLWLGECFFDLN